MHIQVFESGESRQCGQRAESGRDGRAAERGEQRRAAERHGDREAGRQRGMVAGRHGGSETNKITWTNKMT